MRHGIRIVATIALILTLSCNRYGTDGRSGANGTGQIDEDVIATTVTATPVPVEVVFTGLMCHVFDQKAPDGRTVNRTVMLKDSGHPARMYVPKQVNLKELEDATGIKPVNGGHNSVLIEPIDGLAIRVISWDGSTVTAMQPTLDHSGKKFNDLVPHLKEVSENTMTAVDETALAETTDGTKWAAFFELEGGTFDASPYCMPSQFKKKKQQRGFAEIVYLEGEVPTPAALQFRKHGGAWKTVTFTTQPRRVLIEFEVISTMKKSHFPLFQALGNATKWDDVELVDCPTVGPVPGCSNNQYP